MRLPSTFKQKQKKNRIGVFFVDTMLTWVPAAPPAATGVAAPREAPPVLLLPLTAPAILPALFFNAPR